MAVFRVDKTADYTARCVFVQILCCQEARRRLSSNCLRLLALRTAAR